MALGATRRETEEMKISDFHKGQVWRDGRGKLRRIENVAGDLIFWRRVSLAGVVHGPIRRVRFVWVESGHGWTLTNIKAGETE